MGFNRVKNNFYPFGEYPEERLIVGGSFLEYNGAGAMPTMTVEVNTGSTLVVTCEGTDYTIIGNTGIAQTIDHVFVGVGINLVIFSGDLDEVTYFLWTTSANIQGDVVCFATWTALTVLKMQSTSISGDIGSLAGLTSLTSIFFFVTPISGDILGIGGLTALTDVRLNSTSITGDIASLSGLINLTILRLYSSSIDTYTAGVLPDWDACTIGIQNLGLDVTEVNNFLINLDTASTASVKTLTMDGTNAAPTGAGAAAVISLVGKGWTVITS